MKKITPVTLSKIILGITLSSLIILFYFFYVRLQSLIEYGNLVDQTNVFKYKTQHCLTLLKDAEAGQRGFMLTNDTIFLKSVTDANIQLFIALNELEEMAKELKEDLSLILRFRMAVNDKLEFINYEIKDYTGIENFRARKEITMSGKPLMDRVKYIAELLNKNLDSKLQLRGVIKVQYALITPIILVCILVISLLLLITAWRIIVRELEKRVVMQKELDYHLEALKRSNTDLEQFAYVASHDLNEPLRKIQAFGNLVVTKHSAQLDEEGKNMIERMQAAAERMQTLISDLLIYSRATREQIKSKSIHLNKTLEVVKDLLSEEIFTHNASIISDDLPVIKGSSTQMQQLFQNLISNSIKFTENGNRPEIQIRYYLAKGSEIKGVKVNEADKWFHKIVFRDNGIGFDEQFSEKIFEIFQRLHGISKYKGSGIGLAICKKIVYNHRGYISVNSKEGEGSQFMVYLPK